MKRKLFKQLLHEWRSNLWIAVELLVVSVVLWYVTDYLTVQAIVLSKDQGFDAENCYMVSYSYLSESNPMYDSSDTTLEAKNGHFLQMTDRIRNFPGVEQLALCSHTGVPYKQNSWIVNLTRYAGADTTIISGTNIKQVSPEYLTMLRIKGPGGETPEELAKVIESGRCIISGGIYILTGYSQEKIDLALEKGACQNPSQLVGQSFMCEAFSTSDSLRIGAVKCPAKRTEYELPSEDIMIPLRLDSDNFPIIMIRVAPDAAEGFEDRFMAAAEEHFRGGNFYVTEAEALADIKEITQAGNNEEVRNFIVVMVFILTSIFLGITGTFWFRTQQRTGEIAIRKVNGATPASIMKRLLSEGILILAIVTPAALFFDWLLCHYQLNTPLHWLEPYFSPPRFFIAAAIVFALLALMITAGILFPAIRAMRTDPATALKDE